MALGLEHCSDVKGILAASVRIADHMGAKYRSICTFSHKYLRLSSSRVQCDVHRIQA